MRDKRCLSRLRGVTLVETVVTTGISCAILFAVFDVGLGLSRQSDKDATRIPINSMGRAVMDDILYYVRGTKAVSSASTATKIIVSAPSYDPSTSGVVTGTNDTITIEFDNTNKTISETIAVTGGTVRKATNAHIVAKNVESAVFRYYGRQTFPLASFNSSAAATKVFTLDNDWKTGTTPTVALAVNGTGYIVPSSTMPVTFNAANRTVTVGNVPGGVGAAEIRYELAPGISGLSSATHVSILLQLMKKDSRQVNQVFTIAGSARLRNNPSSL